MLPGVAGGGCGSLCLTRRLLVKDYCDEVGRCKPFMPFVISCLWRNIRCVFDPRSRINYWIRALGMICDIWRASDDSV